MTTTADKRPKVSAVIPCLDEARTIGICVQKAMSSFEKMGVVGEVVVADNGSTDGSQALAAEHGARVIHQPIKGYGAALRAGMEAARGEIIVMADADDSYDWTQIAPFAAKIDEGYDLVMGNRFRGGIDPGAMPPLHRYLGNPVLSLIARVAFGVGIGDFHCGMRALRKDAFERMQLRSDGMEFATEMVANASHQRLRIAEIPTKLHKDKRGRPPHLRSFRDGWRHLRFILTYAPDYLFVAPGLGMLALGLVLQLLLVNGPVDFGSVHLGIHFLALGAALSLIGFNVFNLGVFAKTLMSQRYAGLQSHIADFAQGAFSLEKGLITGGLLVLIGLGIDASILGHWLRHRSEPMEDTVHLAFVASTAIVLGMNLMFSSFLLNMLLDTDSKQRTSVVPSIPGEKKP